MYLWFSRKRLEPERIAPFFKEISSLPNLHFWVQNVCCWGCNMSFDLNCSTFLPNMSFLPLGLGIFLWVKPWQIDPFWSQILEVWEMTFLFHFFVIFGFQPFLFGMCNSHICFMKNFTMTTMNYWVVWNDKSDFIVDVTMTLAELCFESGPAAWKHGFDWNSKHGTVYCQTTSSVKFSPPTSHMKKLVKIIFILHILHSPLLFIPFFGSQFQKKLIWPYICCLRISLTRHKLASLWVRNFLRLLGGSAG